MTTSSILILGATGYLGGTLLAPFKRIFSKDYRIIATVRSESQVSAVRAAGVDEIIVTSFAELEKFTGTASEADIVVNATDSDDLPLTKALTEGLRIRARISNKRPIIIHTSGAGLVAERPDRTFFESKEYKDTSEEDIRDIDPKALHRNVDLELSKADSEGLISAYIICPPVIYGVGTGPGHRISIQIPSVIHDALQRKRAAHIGAGETVFDNVHVEDIAELYIFVAKHAMTPEVSKDKTPHSKFYFAVASRHIWGESTRQIGDILYARRKVDAPGAISITPKASSVLVFSASTARTISERAYGLGWKPTKPSLKDSMEADVDELLRSLQ